MRFELTLHCDGAAFDPDPVPEIHRLLLIAAGKLRADHPAEDLGNVDLALLDYNGNTAGHARFTDEGAEAEGAAG